MTIDRRIVRYFDEIKRGDKANEIIQVIDVNYFYHFQSSSISQNHYLIACYFISKMLLRIYTLCDYQYSVFQVYTYK